jgi:hypothetical protein
MTVVITFVVARHGTSSRRPYHRRLAVSKVAEHCVTLSDLVERVHRHHLMAMATHVFQADHGKAAGCRSTRTVAIAAVIGVPAAELRGRSNFLHLPFAPTLVPCAAALIDRRCTAGEDDRGYAC